ncbi:hypothetical protein CAPTEDRAFT_225838 [Capitella teleta]|uniref:Methylthioribose-1-phosphate isomerase n=1 Tax=Capitella teleta TaxID=283909 RepID=R7ULC5_CAPTE|nr:hypothetical protein CAPTEDRAFT_225838 [Capitella teleta]|eukprot:ELU04603.1 hypothetical protein CAPTEDRAFT_225838 [Capitella teleta]
MRNMVRGAPAIGVVGSLSLAVELIPLTFSSFDDLKAFMQKKLDYLVSARPTAVNMADCRSKLMKRTDELIAKSGVTVEEVKAALVSMMEGFLPLDVETNKKMCKFGADHILENVKDEKVIILTHCNTGSLATAGYGTALGVVRSLHGRGLLEHCFCTETRPYNQGARLTAYELVHDNIPSTLICDDMASVAMKLQGVSAVAVGADRVVANGDSANKIGTYQLSIVAKYHNIPFYIVAPSTSIDLNLATGDDIVIEERPHNELTCINGKRIAAKGIGVWNPAFDVAPAELITGGIVTEFGVFKPSELKEKLTAALKASS